MITCTTRHDVHLLTDNMRCATIWLSKASNDLRDAREQGVRAQFIANYPDSFLIPLLPTHDQWRDERHAAR